MRFKVPPEVYSRQDIQSVVLELRGYALWLTHDEVKARLDAKHVPSSPPELSPAAVATLREWCGKKKVDTQALADLINTLTSLAQRTPSLTITLAAPAPDQLKRSITSWCRENIASDTLVNFQFNSNILGGMVVRFGSRIFDWSFRRRILNERQRFPEVLRHV